MRSTLRIDDDLLRELTERAHTKWVTLSELVNLALQSSLAAEKRPRRVIRQKTHNFGRPWFDVTKANAVAAALEDEAILGKLAGSSRGSSTPAFCCRP